MQKTHAKVALSKGAQATTSRDRSKMKPQELATEELCGGHVEAAISRCRNVWNIAVRATFGHVKADVGSITAARKSCFRGRWIRAAASGART